MLSIVLGTAGAGTCIAAFPLRSGATCCRDKRLRLCWSSGRFQSEAAGLMTSCLWNDCRLVAGRARSPTAAFWQSGLKHLGLADWPLSGNRYGGFGSKPQVQVMGKRSIAPRLRVDDALCPLYPVQPTFEIWRASMTHDCFVRVGKGTSAVSDRLQSLHNGRSIYSDSMVGRARQGYVQYSESCHVAFSTPMEWGLCSANSLSIPLAGDLEEFLQRFPDRATLAAGSR